MSAQAAPDSRCDAADVAVIMPAFNAARFLRESLGSVLAQTGTRLQVVLVDDGSTDDTPAIARSLNDARVAVFSGSNRGPSHARNVGLDAAGQARFIAFVDADDCWDPDKLQTQTAFLDTHPEVVTVGCVMRYVSSRGRPLGTTGEAVTADNQEQVVRGELFPFHMSSLMVRSAAIAQAGGFDEFVGTRGSEDLEFYSRLARLGPMRCLPVVLGSVRIHADSAMARRRREINQAARFVRQRIVARTAGRDLTWSDFVSGDSPGWSERRRDFVERAYRAAALSYADERYVRAAGYGAIAALVDPVYTLRRGYRQRVVRSATGLMPRTDTAASRTEP